METQSTRCSSISEEIEKFPVGSQVIYWPLVQQTKKQGVKLATGENPWLHPVFGYHFQIWDFLTTWKACLNAKGVVTFGVVLPHVEVKKLEKNGGKGRLQFFLAKLYSSMTFYDHFFLGDLYLRGPKYVAQSTKYSISVEFRGMPKGSLGGTNFQFTKTNESRSFLIYDLIFEAH